MKNKSIFVYCKAEVRLPCWEVGQGIEEFGDEAKPYNQGRDKKLTNRCTVEEVVYYALFSETTTSIDFCQNVFIDSRAVSS